MIDSFLTDTHCSTNNPAQGVPGPFIKPVEELVEAIGGEMVGWSVVEPEATKQKQKTEMGYCNAEYSWHAPLGSNRLRRRWKQNMKQHKTDNFILIFILIFSEGSKEY